MKFAEIQRLRAELRSDRDAWEARVAELPPLAPAGNAPAVLAQSAVALHHAYGAIEAGLARTARWLEGSVPEGADWHQQLLHTMTLEITKVRPAVLSPESSAGLRALLGFRHFFRHAYAVAWDPAELTRLSAIAQSLRAPLARDLDALDAFLEQLAAAAGP